ncbi:GNAT family N-acetyltransferase [Enemella evansiae]|uniref:GNAT family N-acetyltransferase n=1 Tax=Enemella evansiae TaxID=2016499 RepID=UPI0015C619DA|nr:N-acetyltransferase [Enemella evansiae]
MPHSGAAPIVTGHGRLDRSRAGIRSRCRRRSHTPRVRRRAAPGRHVSSIRQSPRYRSGLALVARYGGQIVGFVMRSGTDLVADDGTNRDALTLTPLAVAPEFQRRGIGAALVRTVIAEADGRHEPLVVLEGSPRYYGRLGFRFAADFGIHIELPEWAPREAAQVYPLLKYDGHVRGRAVYPPAIAAVAD